MACGRCVRKTQKKRRNCRHQSCFYMNICENFRKPWWIFDNMKMRIRQHLSIEQHIIVSVPTLRSHRYENKWKFICNIREEIIELSPENWYWTRGEKLCDDGDGKKRIIKLSFQAFWGSENECHNWTAVPGIVEEGFHCFSANAHNLADAIFFSLFNVTTFVDFPIQLVKIILRARQSRRLCHDLTLSGFHVCAHVLELTVRKVTAMRLFTCELNAEKIQWMV